MRGQPLRSIVDLIPTVWYVAPDMNIVGAKAAMTAFTHATRGETVNEDELMRRHRICLACPMLRQKSGAETQVSAILGGLANRHKVPRDVSKKMCGVCGCSMLLLLPALPADLHKDTEEEESVRPDRCWVTA